MSGQCWQHCKSGELHEVMGYSEGYVAIRREGQPRIRTIRLETLFKEYHFRTGQELDFLPIIPRPPKVRR